MGAAIWCENACMQKSSAAVVTLFSAGIFLLGNALAQQPPPSIPQQPPPAKASKAPPAGARRAPASNAQTLALVTPKDKASYALGLNIGKSLQRDSLDVDPNILVRGIKDAMAGGKTLLTEDEAKAVLNSLQNELRQKQEARMQQLAETNKKEGEAFLAANKTKEGVVTLPSGLQYKILKQGTGPKPSAAHSVVCNYRGTLINDTEFDSSYKRGQPATFPVGKVIRGWTEALQLMPVGSKWQLFVPAELAYGPRGAGPDIGPNATLIFEVELLSIQGKTQ
jgi:FKBP-type peptidyl-prolyl cis-trans isomerase